ncbi:MAG: Holliday junction resolvase RuvX [Bacteroidales bacterium]|nr:Holliday junction resolvase RuvX [Bacteroidales bacterium]
MGRIMAIDYGIKRTGLAVTDPLGIIASGLDTVETPKLMSYIEAYSRRETVDRFVVGDARHMDNTPSESARYIEPFVIALKKKFPDIPVERVDERFTSKIAFQSMIDSGMSKKKRRDKAIIDTVSAVLILQSYMRSTEIAKNRNSEAQ